VRNVIARGYRTRDIWTEGTRNVSCSEMGDAVAGNL
jgi:3-isopropylmalate dehydrogenase